jgi:hypothetical protein
MYLNSFLSEKKARLSIRTSYMAFQLLIASFAFAVAKHLTFTSDDANSNAIASLLISNARIHPVTVNELLIHAAFFSPANPRQGTIFDHPDMDKDTIDAFRKAGVPIWFVWDQPNLYKDDYTLRIKKSLDNGDTAPPITYYTENVLRHDIRSGQFPGETWRNFFSRGNYTAPAMQLIPPPLSPSTRVWRWLPIRNHRIRFLVPAAQRQHTLDSYISSRKRYSFDTDQWDVCSEFEEESGDPRVNASSNANPDNNSHRDEHDDPSDSEDLTPEDSPSSSHTDFPSEDLMNISYADDQLTPPEPLRIHGQELRVQLHHDYGFVPTAPQDLITTPASAQMLKDIGKIFGLYCEHIDNALAVDIMRFVSETKLGRTDVASDLNPSHSRHILSSPGRTMNIKRTLVIRNGGKPETYYWIQPRLALSQSQDQKLLVPDIMTALLCIRLQRKSLHDIARHLAQHGRSFSTVVSPKAFSSARNTYVPHNLTLGWRHDDYKFNYADFLHYITIVRLFLQIPHIRSAAFRHGGIIGRIACYALCRDAEHAMHQDACYVQPIALYNNVTVDGVEHLEDVLSTDNQELICGLYRKYTCKLCVSFMSPPLISCFSARTNHQGLLVPYPAYLAWLQILHGPVDTCMRGMVYPYNPQSNKRQFLSLHGE